MICRTLFAQVALFVLLAAPVPPALCQTADESTATGNTGDGKKKRDEGPLDTFSIGAVVVTGHRIQFLEQAATMTTIDGEDLAKRGDKSLDQTLQMVPGVTVYTHTKGYPRLRLRGYDQNRIAILIDGIPLQDVYSSEMDISTISVFGVSKVIVNRGVSSSLYGTDGAIGSVNVITSRPSRPFGKAVIDLGFEGIEYADDYSNSAYSLALGGPIGDFYFLLSGTVRLDQGYSPSAKLDKAARREWFDKLIPYGLYGKRFDDLSFPARDQYLDDTGKWDHTEMNRYDVSGKAGYAISSRSEVGLSSGFHYHEGMTNTYQPNCYSDFNAAKEKWRNNRRPYFSDEQISVKDFAVRNRAFVWPEVYRLNLSPYWKAEFGDFTVRLVGFLIHGYAKQEGYASTDHTYFKGYSALFNDRKNPDNYDPFYDIKNYGSVGFRLLPTYDFSKYHRLSLGLHWRYDTFTEEGQAMSATLSPHILALAGAKPYSVADLSAHQFSLALEYEGRPFKGLKLTAGGSYDSQTIGRFKLRQNGEFDDGYVPRDSSLIFGTRDSFNPVLGIVFDPVKHRLRLRAAGSIKSRFPTLSEYSKIPDETYDEGLKPERIYNANAGIELFFLDRQISVRCDYFYSMIKDRIAKVASDEPPVNVERTDAQGVETIVQARLGSLGGVVDLIASLSYTYLHARNRDDSPEEQVNKGEFLEFTPPHQFTGEVRLNFVTGTTLSVWGRYSHGGLIYVMCSAPAEYAEYNTDYFTTVELNNPFILNLKLTQELGDHLELYLSANNLLDNYEMDPFNPGPGRVFYLGVSANW